MHLKMATYIDCLTGLVWLPFRGIVVCMTLVDLGSIVAVCDVMQQHHKMTIWHERLKSLYFTAFSPNYNHI